MVDVCRQLKDRICTLPSALLEITDSIYLYGSMARGDTSSDSDCDLLIAIDDCSEETFDVLRKTLNQWCPELNCEIALYQMSALKVMQKKGSLFLWHIKTEAIIIYSNGHQLADILRELPEYQGGRDALDEYCEIMKDIENEESSDKEVIQYNLSVMATLIRNTCIICCYLFGDKQFGRVSPIKSCSSYFGTKFPIYVCEYEQLYLYRTSINRNQSMPAQRNLECYYFEWKERTRKLLDLAFTLME